MIAFETGVQIDCPIEDVFDYVSDSLNFPRWNSAVQAVRKTSAGEQGVAPRYSMERDLPGGCAVNVLEVVESQRPHAFAIRATAGPTPFLYRYRFTAETGETVLKLNAQVELSGVAALLPALARRAVKNGVDDNLVTLKHVLEGAAADRRPA